MTIKSPLTNSFDIIKIREFETSFIISEYEKQLNIDVSKYFENLKKIALYECQTTGYKFFYPPVEGDSNFYQQLEKFPWYYMEWKWEHKKAYELIKKSEKVLEIGSGGGSFVKRLVDNGIECHGLELNEKSVTKGQKKGLNILNISSTQYAIDHPQEYDVVCSFQVLEHVDEVNSFLRAAIKLIKPNGKLILSVPNNNSFIGSDKFNILDMPPHHASLWNEEVFIKISEYFHLKLIKTYKEPLQKYHFRYYYYLKFGKKIEKELGLIGRLSNKFLSRLYYLILLFSSNKIDGHTILVEYKKYD